MIEIRKSSDRGLAEHGWLKSFHTFSFADYFDPKFMGFSVLRVINEDRIDGGTGFGAHPHRDMEIISYVIEGALEHQDSMGNSTLIKPGEVQRLSAGTGIRHSEKNHLAGVPTHFLQIWVVPEKMGVTPSYGQKDFTSELSKNELVLVASKDGREGSISINQDASLYAAKSELAGGKHLAIGPGRRAWVQLVKGELIVNDEKLFAGDGAKLQEVDGLNLQWKAHSEFLVFDLP